MQAGVTAYRQGDYAEAVKQFEVAVTGAEAFGRDDGWLATSLNNLAELYMSQGRYAEAEPLYKRALAILEKVLGPEHPNLATSLNNLAGLYGSQGRIQEALTYARKATAIHRKRAIEGAATVSAGAQSEHGKVRHLFRHHAALLAKTIEESPELSATLTAEGFEVGQLALVTAEGFEVGQLALASSAGQALSRMAARFGAGDAELAKMVRRRQDAVDEWRTTDAALVKAVSAGIAHVSATFQGVQTLGTTATLQPRGYCRLTVPFLRRPGTRTLTPGRNTVMRNLSHPGSESYTRRYDSEIASAEAAARIRTIRHIAINNKTRPGHRK